MLPTPVNTGNLPETARQYATHAKAENTRRAYASDWQHFCDWCQQRALSPLPAKPETVAEYLAQLASTGKRASTITRRASTIASAHRAAGHRSPTESELVRVTLQGIRRSLGTAPAQKAPLRVDDLRTYVLQLGDSLQAKRDKALLLLGYAGAFRRSELVALNLEDLHFTTQGVRITIRRSKTDQEAQGMVKAIPYGKNRATCPVRALQEWLTGARITSGAVFRRIDRWGHVGNRISDQTVALVVKRACKELGLPQALFGAHSLRAGLVTDAYAHDVSEAVIQQQSGHKSVPVLRRYRREADLFKANVLNALPL